MLQRAARNAYSWWWASHIRTKQSKWLDQNLQDMEEKVEYILKIIDEDGDTFAQRAEMYYRKRPELMNFVEDSFRCYRALAERYDHLSRELQSANRTIATVFPERVQLEMDDDEGSFHPKAAPVPKSKGTVPTAPNLSNGKLPSFGYKSSKKPSRLMSKKGLIKLNSHDDSPAPSSGLTKDEALEEIDKLQKEILGLQTEGEFLKSSYERGMEKYNDIEINVTEKQRNVNSLQDEFGIGTVIEDDEARTLMTSSALKSCKDALSHLQEIQKQSAQEAREEHEKVHKVREKMELLKERFGCRESLGPELLKNRENEVEAIDVELLRARIKERLGFDSGVTLTMGEMADKVDELVDNVINLETAVCSQNANLKRLRSATNELQIHFLSLENNNGSLPEGADNLRHRIRELEEEFREVQNLDQSIQVLNNELHIKAIEAGVNMDELSEKLPTVKHEEETSMSYNEDESLWHGEEGFGVDPARELLRNGDLMSMSDLGTFDNAIDVKGKKKHEHHLDLQIVEHTSVDSGKEEGYRRNTSGISSFFEDGKFGESQTAISVNVDDGTKNDNPMKDDEMNDAVLVKERENQVDLLNYAFNSTADGENQVDLLNYTFNSTADGENQVDLLNYAFNSTADGLKTDLKANKPEISTNEHEGKRDDHQLGKSSNSVFDESTNGKISHFAHIQEETSLRKDMIVPVNNNGEENKNEVSDRLFSSIEDANVQIEQKKRVLPNQAEKNSIETQHVVNSHLSVAQEIHDKEEDEDEDEPDWKQLFLSDLDDKEMILLQEYTKTLRSYRDVKKKLNEVEKKRRANMFQTAVQIKVLTRTNSSNKAEIQSLKKKLDSLQVHNEETKDSGDLQVHGEKTRDTSELQVHDKETKDSSELQLHNEETKDSSEFQIQTLKEKAEPDTLKNVVPDVTGAEEESPSKTVENVVLEENEDASILQVDEALPLSSLEDRIRTEIDDLLQENIDFWFRFTTSVHQIQKFQTSIEDLQTEVAKIKEKKQDLPANRTHSVHSEIRPIYRHLREIQTELSLYLEQNGVLKDDLYNRLSSLTNLQEEITRLSNAGPDDKNELNEYQAAKFQGEIMNMKQENNKVAADLELGFTKVKHLQGEIKRTLGELDEELGIRGNNQQQRQRTRIPLRSFLFGVKLKKQSTSFFSCINPALHRQNSDVTPPQR